MGQIRSGLGGYSDLLFVAGGVGHFRSSVIIYRVRRLSAHPSLVLCGSNSLWNQPMYWPALSDWDRYKTDTADPRRNGMADLNNDGSRHSRSPSLQHTLSRCFHLMPLHHNLSKHCVQLASSSAAAATNRLYHNFCSSAPTCYQRAALWLLSSIAILPLLPEPARHIRPVLLLSSTDNVTGTHRTSIDARYGDIHFPFRSAVTSGASHRYYTSLQK